MVDGRDWADYKRFVRTVGFFSVLVAVMVSGCVTRVPQTEPYLDRTTYQKIYVDSYTGAASAPGGGAVTARGTKYRDGAVASASADWSRWPVGTVFRVLATGKVYEVDDFSEDVVGRNEIQLYRSALSNLPSGGRKYVTIEIIKWGSPRSSAKILEQARSSTVEEDLEEFSGAVSRVFAVGR